ncbi:MAG: hypothetical protein C7B45_01595 [Sulfobacillus acidophilus]|uniref:Cyclohexanecarboxylate-CoA ligase n=1 Tax=Sulfobacillus acidophilus TaxID=53633 RepID=A0A2T2WNC3_9FIRM|nr:MAG: hypothetical protein C7B45_01595 [Sulfobacillus acidophilus]
MSVGFHSAVDEERYRKLGLWSDETLIDHFTTVVQQFASKIAVIDTHGQYTYGDLYQAVGRLASVFANFGIEAGDVVAAQLPGWVELPVIHLACNVIGAIFLPIHDGWRETEAGHLLRKSQAKAIMVPHCYRGFNYAAMIDELITKEEMTNLRLKMTIHGTTRGWQSWDILMGQATPLTMKSDEKGNRLHSANEPCMVIVSSGTTALPKMSIYTDNNFNATLLRHFCETMKLGSDDVAGAIAPPGTGGTGYVFPVLTPLLIGARVVMLERWADPEDALRLMATYHCTYATAIPSQMIKLMLIPELGTRFNWEAFSRFNNAGAPLPPEVAKEVEHQFGCRVHTVYGASDGGVPTMTSIDDPPEKRWGTVGRILSGCECEVWDDQYHPLPQGEWGEVCWRTPEKSFGYLNDDNETLRLFHNGWIQSGDIGVFDEDGYLRIVGRKKDMILRGGRNISARTVEELLIVHPAVQDCAVAAMPDPVLGERACAFVVLNAGQNLTFEEMIGFLKDHRIAIWELPERLEIVDALPKSSMGKVKKAELTDYITKKLAQEQSTQSD